MNNFLLILPDLEVPTDLANIGSILDFKSCGSSLLDLLLMTESLGKGVKMSKVMSLNPLEWESAKFFVKGKRVNILGLVGQMVSVTTVQLCPHSTEVATDNT